MTRYETDKRLWKWLTFKLFIVFWCIPFVLAGKEKHEVAPLIYVATAHKIAPAFLFFAFILGTAALLFPWLLQVFIVFARTQIQEIKNKVLKNVE